MKLKIGFVGTRFAGLDGVSLETKKWDTVLQRMGHKTYWFAGELDTDPKHSFIAEEAHFHYPENDVIQKQIFGCHTRKREITNKIQEQKEILKGRLYEFLSTYSIDMIIAENCLAIPMQIPLALAITEVIAETGIPAVGHHHDFSWERDRYIVNAVGDYLDMAFPPDLPSMRHVVINSLAQKELAMRKGVSSLLIPNVIDYSVDPMDRVDPEKYTSFRDDFGFTLDDILFLQPTRIVARKGIEHAIELVERLKNPKIKLLITHSSGDEGLDYYRWVIDDAKRNNVEVHFLENKLHEGRDRNDGDTKGYTMWDIYPHADFITYPSLFEGFGNAFLEAVYYRKPMLVNRYSIFIADIEPKGFDVVSMEGYLSSKTVESVRNIIDNREVQQRIVEKNFQLARKHFSYDLLQRRLKSIFISFYGTFSM